MAFLNEMKAEICSGIDKKVCCRRMVLFGILAARGKMEEGDAVSFRISDENAAALALKLIGEQFGRQVETLPQKHGGRLHSFLFHSFSARKFIAELETRFLCRPLVRNCEKCADAFLKGVFLAAGHITDPEKAYHLELSLGDRAEAFLPLLEREYGIRMRTAHRRAETLLYVKDSGTLEEFMARLGLNDAVFRFINCKIEKQFRNEVNRRTNCEASNINRAVGASARVLAAATALEKENLLSTLPPEVEAATRLRLANPEASLAQLAALSSPPLTKSGMNHRMNKMMQYAVKFGVIPGTGSDSE